MSVVYAELPNYSRLNVFEPYNIIDITHQEAAFQSQLTGQLVYEMPNMDYRELVNGSA